VGGDGAIWIRQGAELLGAEYQYSCFHLERDLRRLFGGSPEAGAVRRTLENNDRAAFNLLLEALKKEAKDPSQRERLGVFQSLINSVWEDLTS